MSKEDEEKKGEKEEGGGVDSSDDVYVLILLRLYRSLLKVKASIFCLKENGHNKGMTKMFYTSWLIRGCKILVSL